LKLAASREAHLDYGLADRCGLRPTHPEGSPVLVAGTDRLWDYSAAPREERRPLWVSSGAAFLPRQAATRPCRGAWRGLQHEARRRRCLSPWPKPALPGARGAGDSSRAWTLRPAAQQCATGEDRFGDSSGDGPPARGARRIRAAGRRTWCAERLPCAAVAAELASACGAAAGGRLCEWRRGGAGEPFARQRLLGLHARHDKTNGSLTS
jgi:hypothetical protein